MGDVMSAVLLLGFPSHQNGARSWILEHAARLALEGKAELKFIGTEQGQTGRADAETIALEFGSIDCARTTLVRWRRDTGFPALIEMRLLQIEGVTAADAIFP
jgi:hypothetical protein